MRIVIVDPNEIFRDGLSCLFEGHDDLEVVGQASDGREALRRIEEHRPDVVLLEVSVPELNGADLTRRVKQISPGTKVIALSTQTDPVIVREVFDAGASGYVVKASGEDELLRALRAVQKGGTWVAPDVAQALVGNGARDGDPTGVFGELTPREREVLQLVAEGCTSKEIARRMSITVNTVDTHRHHVMKKLEANTVADLVKLAIRAGITSVDG